MDKKDLSRLRDKIQKLDIELFSLIFRRVDLVKKIGKIKSENNIKITHPTREETLIRIMNNLPSNCLDKSQIKSIYKILFEISKKEQKDII